MKINLTDKNLTKLEKDEIGALLLRKDQSLQDDLEQMWYMMDLIWNDCGCDNKHLDMEKLGKFYSHPVWLLNGLFIEQHEISMAHRQAIAEWVVYNKFKNVVDYGGGFGTLARLIAAKDKNIQMNIYEPHPSEFGLKRAAKFENIKIKVNLESGYDCLISTDVLEHVPNPLKNFATMIKSVKLNGYLVIANNFSPVIECHLPQNFHFRYTFNVFAKMMGLEVVGILEGSHAKIFKKVEKVEPNGNMIRFCEKLSKFAFPIIEILKPILRPVKRLIIK